MTRFFVLPAACCLLPALVFAQDDRPSHVPIPRATDADPARLFRERIEQSQTRADLGSLMKQFGAGGPFGNPEQIQKLLESNPQLRDAARKMAEELANGDPQTRERLRGLIGSVLQSNPELTRRYGLTPEAVEDRLKSLGRQGPPGELVAPPGRPSRPRAEPPPRPADRPADGPRPDPAEQAARREWAERIAGWAERFPRDRLGPLRDSPEVKDLFRRLSESAADALRGGGGRDGLDAQLARWEARWNAARDWLPQELPAALRGMKLPDLSRLPHPNLHVPHLEVSPPAMPAAPHFGGPALDLPTAANVALVLFGAAILAAVAWRLRSGGLSAAGGSRGPLGPWPLDPARVATREELIRAFEYLSLLRCGEPARAWHHRAIAACLGGTESERRAAAERLAALYEQARYAPAAGGEPDWTAARGPLAELAGAG